MDSCGDADLVARFTGGDAGAFDALHRRHAGWVCAYLRRAGLGHADVADVAQDAFVRAFRAAGQFDPARGTFGGWLAAIARNCLVRHLQRMRSAKTADGTILADSLPGREDDPETASSRMEEAAAVEDCVSRLPGELRRIVALRYVAGQTTRSIAPAAGISEAGVRNRLAEAQALLRRCLESKGVL